MAWEDFEKKAKEASSGGMFIRLKAGEEIVGAFRGEPRVLYKIYQDKTEYDHKVEGSTFRFKINFVVKEGDKWVAKIWESSATDGTKITAVKQEYGLEDSLFKIRRDGQGKETVYHILYKGPLGEDKSVVDEVVLNALKGKPITQSGDEDIPF